MQEKQIIPNFVRKLYSLNTRRTNNDGSVTYLVENSDNGSVAESNEGEVFVYNVDRKIAGIVELHELLAHKGLILDVIDEKKTVDGVHKSLPRIVIRRSSDVDLYKDLSPEQRTAFDELINAQTLYGRKHLVKALVTRNLAGVEVAEALDIAEAAEIENAVDKEDKEQLDLEIKYLQMQLDIIFASTAEVKSDLNKIHSIIAKLQDEKKLSAAEEIILFAFIEHTYGSVENFLEEVNPVDPFLSAIHDDLLKDLNKGNLLQGNCSARIVDSVIAKEVKKLAEDEKIFLARQLKKFGIDLNKTKKDDLKDEALAFFTSIEGKIGDLKKILKPESRTISKDNIRDFGKVSVLRKMLVNIARNHDLENSLRVLDGQTDDATIRLRTCYDEPEAEISSINQSLLWVYGLESIEKISGVTLKDFESNSVRGSNEASLKQQFSPHKSFLTASREYDESLMLEEGHVIAITNKLLEKQGVIDSSVRFISVKPENKHDSAAATSSKKEALIEAANGTPVSLQISDRGHWITVCLLPVIEEDGKIKKVEVVSMDSMGSCKLGKDLVGSLKEMAAKIGLEISDLHNMSVEGQQHGMCCGFATAVNGFAILKTYRDLAGKLPVKDDGSFNPEEFTKSLLPNVLYRKEKGQTILYNNRPAPELSMNGFVRQFGGLILQEVASKESAQEVLANVKLERLKRLDSNSFQELDFAADSKLLKEVLHVQKAVAEDSEVPKGQQRVKWNKEFYDVSQEDYQRMTDIDYWKGLDSILNGGPLDDILSNDRTRGLFIKILKDSFKNGKDPHTSSFDRTSRELSRIVHIDDGVKDKINAVIAEAKSENPNIDLSWFDAILLFLYNFPIIGRLVAWSNADIVRVAVLIDKLEEKTQSWEKYASSGLRQAFNDLIPTA